VSVTVVTWLWRDHTRDNRGYVCGAKHVKILANMLKRNITVPYQFICVTDDIIDGVNCVPMNWECHVPGTVYARLKQQDPKWCLENLGEKVLSLDIDVVITRNIDHILSRKEDFVIWRNPNFPKPLRAFYQSSVRLFDYDARPQLYEDFDKEEDPKWVNWRFGGREQAWISEKLPWDEAYFSDKDGIYGAGRLRGAGVYSELPENACIVSFPGARAPWQEEVWKIHPWVQEHYK
jgi:hypothetical protein